MPGNDAFSRDLGYLDKFFDKLDAHAGTLPSDAGQRLRALLVDERKAWAEIKQLVGAGDAPPAAAEEKAAPAQAAAPAEAPRPYTRALQMGLAALPREPAVPVAPAGDAPERAGLRTSLSRLTVGSLKRRR